jgi:hypothetical protein
MDDPLIYSVFGMCLDLVCVSVSSYVFFVLVNKLTNLFQVKVCKLKLATASTNSNVSRCQFHQRFSRSFSAPGAQKLKKDSEVVNLLHFWELRAKKLYVER